MGRNTFSGSNGSLTPLGISPAGSHARKTAQLRLALTPASPGLVRRSDNQSEMISSKGADLCGCGNQTEPLPKQPAAQAAAFMRQSLFPMSEQMEVLISREKIAEG